MLDSNFWSVGFIWGARSAAIELDPKLGTDVAHPKTQVVANAFRFPEIGASVRKGADDLLKTWANRWTRNRVQSTPPSNPEVRHPCITSETPGPEGACANREV